MSGATSAILAGAAIAGAGVSYVNGQQQKKSANRAADQAEDQARQQATAAEKQLSLAEQDTNRANQKRANTGSLLDAASQAGKAGASGTMLTGPMGVDPKLLNLGKSTLLGS